MIEYKILYYIEARDFMISDPHLSKECLDRERKIDLDRRAEKAARIKRNEFLERIRQQEKNDERSRKNNVKVISKAGRNPMKRSEKESPLRSKKEEVVLTEE